MHKRKICELTEDWSGDLYCGIKLHWDYIARTVDISMPGYIKKLLQKYKHKMPTKPRHCPYTPAPKQYGAEAQALLPIDISPKLSDEEIKEIQRIVESILYYARAVDITVLMALSSIASEQT
jgi:CO dehydrogenase/acetyl-CoA synthase delta subunit